MPELPEVETVRRTLEHQILNEKIKNTEVFYLGLLENVNENEFKKSLCGQTLRKIGRYGKYLFFIFDSVSIISHLRMEGKFFIKPKDEKREKHEHLIITFESGRTLRYHDTRKFGKMALIKSVELKSIMSYPALKKLGIEANSKNLTKEYLYEKLKNLKSPLKTALLNQEILAGLGNIYVDEVCFLSKLSPMMEASKVTLSECEKICKNSYDVLEEAIKQGGTTIRSYTSSLGVTGLFQMSLHVHTKAGSSCEVCQTKIKKTVVGGRGTYYCPKCQKNKTVVGITGSIASGKSVVSSYLKEKGYVVFDADLIVKDLYEKQEVKELIKSHFPNVFINDKLDKKILAQEVFKGKDQRKILNNLIHPLVKQELMKKIKQEKETLIFIDVPLLYEARFDYLCDYVIAVKVDEEENIKRLMARDNISLDYAKLKIASQMDIMKKCQKANFIIDNSSKLCYTYKQIDDILDKLK